jgi:hypothetical protein
MSQPSTRSPLYRGYRFPPEIISWCVWLYYRFSVSLRDVAELMLARGIEVSHESIRLWTLRFGAEYVRRLRRTRGACSNIWHLDASLISVAGARTTALKIRTSLSGGGSAGCNASKAYVTRRASVPCSARSAIGFDPVDMRCRRRIIVR